MKTIVSKITSRRSFLKGTDCLEIGYPWLSFGAIIALEGIVNKNLKVLEFGSGGSTVFWAKSCKSIKSYETNRTWFEKVREKVKVYKNVELKLSTEAQILKGIENEPNNYYDLALIDSNPKDTHRILLANAVLSKIKINGFLIVDNYFKFGMEKFKYPTSWKIYTFDAFSYSGQGTRICKKII